MNTVVGLISITNNILRRLNLNLRVKNIAEIDRKLINTIYEALFKSQIEKGSCDNDKSNDVTVIKTILHNLSNNILHVSLNHIDAEKVVQRDRVALMYLLEIFQGLGECMKSNNGACMEDKESANFPWNDIDDNCQKLRLKIRDTDIQTDNLALMMNCNMESRTEREKYLEKKIKELIGGTHGGRCPSLMEYVKDNEDRIVLIKDQYSQKPVTPRYNHKVYMIPRNKQNSEKKAVLVENITEPSNMKSKIMQEDDLTKVTGQNDQMTEGSVDLSQGSNETYIVTPRIADEKKKVDIEQDIRVKEAWTKINKGLIHEGYENEFLEMLLREGEDLCHRKDAGSKDLKNIRQHNECSNSSISQPKTRVTPRKCGGGLVKPIIKHIGHSNACDNHVTLSSQNTPRSTSTTTSKDCDGGELVVRLLREFPGLDISDHSLRQMWSQASRQAANIQKIQQEFVSRIGPGEQKVEDAKRRQQLLFKMLRKEALQQARFRQQVEERESQCSLKAKKEKQRQQSAKIKRYYDEFSQQMRARMLQKQAKEEQVFRATFKAALKLQRERINDLRRSAQDKKNDKCVQHQKEVESVETYYRDRFSMLAECLHDERGKLRAQDKWQEEAIEKEKREERKNVEGEIREMQESMIGSQQESYFRELDSHDVLQCL